MPRCIQCDRVIQAGGALSSSVSSAGSNTRRNRQASGAGAWADPRSIDTSFVMVARLADMSMSSMHTQDNLGGAPSPVSRHGGGEIGMDVGEPGLSEHLKRAEMVLNYGTGKVNASKQKDR